MMKVIRFSHADYEKFQKIKKRPPFTARLLQVFLLQDDDVSEALGIALLLETSVLIILQHLKAMKLKDNYYRLKEVVNQPWRW
jgi:hypothetical protein